MLIDTTHGQDHRRIRARDLVERARHSVELVVAAGREPYDRVRHLPRLIPIDPAGLADDGMENRRWIVARLARALRHERGRGRAGHWTYDLNRHIGLMQAFAAERRRLEPAVPAKQIRRPEGGG